MAKAAIHADHRRNAPRPGDFQVTLGPLGGMLVMGLWRPLRPMNTSAINDRTHQ